MNVTLILVTTLMSLGLFSQYKTNKMVSETETPKYEVIKSFDNSTKLIAWPYAKCSLTDIECEA